MKHLDDQRRAGRCDAVRAGNVGAERVRSFMIQALRRDNERGVVLALHVDKGAQEQVLSLRQHKAKHDPQQRLPTCAS